MDDSSFTFQTAIKLSNNQIPPSRPNHLASKRYFKKRSYNFRTFIQDIALIMKNYKSVLETLRSKRLSHDFIERIMLAVTAVNGCAICSWAHSKMALESGCTEDEIHQIMDFNYEGMCNEEVVALTFAQHYAESNGHPSSDALQALIKHYGLEKSKDIINYIRFISIGNKTGNSVEAFKCRLQGIIVENGSWLFEFLIYLFGGQIITQKIMKK